MNKKHCQYQSPHCQGEAKYQHILKLGSMKINQKWVCESCKAYLKRKEK